MDTSTPSPTAGIDRRALLRKAAVAGAVGWTAPVILSSQTASAGVFTAKCAPGAVTGFASFTNNGCNATTSTIVITIAFSGPCPCGGTKTWCSRKNSPGAAVTGGASLSFPVTIGIGATITITGKVALGCVDRDGDIQYAVYNWSMTARDNGGAGVHVFGDEVGVDAGGGETSTDTDSVVRVVADLEDRPVVRVADQP